MHIYHDAFVKLASVDCHSFVFNYIAGKFLVFYVFSNKFSKVSLHVYEHYINAF